MARLLERLMMCHATKADGGSKAELSSLQMRPSLLGGSLGIAGHHFLAAAWALRRS
jgi:hypothetical protein